MTTPELITDEIVEKAVKAHRDVVSPLVCANGMRAAILAIQDDITGPYRILMEGWQRDAQEYKRALKEIMCSEINQLGKPHSKEYLIASSALKGDYHKTDFTEFCEQNPITDKE